MVGIESLYNIIKKKKKYIYIYIYIYIFGCSEALVSFSEYFSFVKDGSRYLICYFLRFLSQNLPSFAFPPLLDNYEQ